MHDRKADYRRVVERAREAAQTAEDARTIAVRREQTEQLQADKLELAKARARVSNAEQEKAKAVEEASHSQAQADAAREQAQAAIAAQHQAEAEAADADARELAAQAQARAQAQTNKAMAARNQQDMDSARKNETRMHLLAELRAVVPTLDTGRGVVATVPDDGFRGGFLRDSYSTPLTRIAAILSVHPDLHVSVEGFSDSAAKEALSSERAEAVRRALVQNGVTPGAISAAGLGDSRPLGSNATAQGRKANSRVEIVISGDTIGKLPLWDSTYTLSTGSQQP